MHELKDLGGILGLLSWDQETYLPAKAGPARAAQLATLQGLYHQRLVAPELGEWLEQAERGALDAETRAMVGCFRRERDHAVRVPERWCGSSPRPSPPGSRAGGRRGPSAASTGSPPRSQRLLELRREQADAVGPRGRALRRAARQLRAGDETARLLRCWSGCARARAARGGARRRGPADPSSSTAGRSTPSSSGCSPSSCWSAGLRPEGRPAGPEHPPVHRRHAPHRRAAHHPRSTRATPRPRCSARFTRAATGSTSRASPRSTTARRWPRRRRWGCTSRSPASGRTSSGRSLPVLGVPLPSAPGRFPEELGEWSWRSSTGPSTGCGARPSGSRRTRSPTTCTSSCARARAAAAARRAGGRGPARGVEREDGAHARAPSRATTWRACCRTSTGRGASSATSRPTRSETCTRPR